MGIAKTYLYQQSRTVSSSVPQSSNVDRLGAYVSRKEGYNYIEFGGTWDGELIQWTDIAKFNTAFLMYDVKARRNIDYYNPDSSSQIEWVGYHDITVKYYGIGVDVTDAGSTDPLYTQSYNFQKVYYPTSDKDTWMQFRPVIDRSDEVYGMVIDYTFTLMNLIDDVQFMKYASTNISSYERGGIADFFNDTMTLSIPVNNYTVYNRIEQIEHKLSQPANNPVATKYTKVFYNSNVISLDVNGEYYGTGTYSITLSDAPKNYKFIFRKYDQKGNLSVYDMSDSVYKLYSRDANGRDIIIEPTYSSNMNSMLGEIEFNISINNIQKLKDVDQSKRFMSIIVVNQDNTQYSMFDFTYV